MNIKTGDTVVVIAGKDKFTNLGEFSQTIVANAFGIKKEVPFTFKEELPAFTHNNFIISPPLNYTKKKIEYLSLFSCF